MATLPSHRRVILAALVVACGAGGCSKGGGVPLPEEGVRPDPAPAGLRVAADRSLTPAGYAARGLPAPDRAWSPKDYEAAVKVLVAVAREDPRNLPRLGSKNSGAVFARLVSPGNLGVLDKKNTPAEKRKALGLQLMAPVKQLLLVYLTASFPDRGVCDGEVLQLTGFLLRVTAAVLDSAEESLASLPADDPRRELRLQELKQARKGVVQQVDGALQALALEDKYRAAERARFARLLEEVLPRLRRQLPPPTREAIPVRVRDLIEKETDPALKAALADLLKAVGD